MEPVWIEALNSVLDDNHLLSLPNGERFYYQSNVKFIFETDNLKHASPATISRLGIIFLEPLSVESVFAINKKQNYGKVEELGRLVKYCHSQLETRMSV